MASDVVVGKKSQTANSKEAVNAVELMVKGLKILSSLRLTVWLFVLSVFLVWTGTLAQGEMSTLSAVNTYFRNWFVWIPFSVLMPANWSPGIHAFLAGGIGFGDFALKGFVFPGGWTLGALMLLNLFSAHAVRFKMRGKGAGLGIGLGLIGVGLMMTLAMIFFGNTKNVIQDQPWFQNWDVLRTTLNIGLGMIWLLLVYGAITISKSRVFERVFLVIAIVILSGLFIWMYGTQSNLQDAALRILWQLIQATSAGVVLLAGCYYLFARRAGIVLLHFGIGLMMINELWVGVYAVEERIFIVENEKTDVATNINKMEVVVTDRSGEEEVVETVVPLSKLRPGAVFQHELLPYDLRLEKFFKNSELKASTSGDSKTGYENVDGEPIEVTMGQGKFFTVKELQPTTGASESVDQGSAYVTLLEKGSETEIGCSLLSQGYSDHRMKDEVDVDLDGATTSIKLRFKQTYKPYYLKLNDAGRKNYIGSETAQSYWSKFEVISKETDESLAADISMNNPLRFGGETFYQSNYYDFGDGVEASTLQVVTNDTWTIPYISCMFVAVGLLAHFSVTLLRFLRNKDDELFGVATSSEEEVVVAKLADDGSEETKKPASSSRGGRRNPIAKVGPKQRMCETLIPLGIVGFIFLGCLSSMLPKSSPSDEFDLVAAGSIPMVNDGRQLPLDSFARNTLAKLNMYESFRNGPDADRQSAITWMLDVMAKPEVARDHKVIYVHHPNIIKVLKLKRIKAKRYSYNEIDVQRPVLQEQFQIAMDLPEEEREAIHVAYLELEQKMALIERLERLFEMPPVDVNNELVFDQLKDYVDFANRVDEFKSGLPLMIPIFESDSDEWDTFVVGAARQWVLDIAKEKDVSTLDEFVDVWWSTTVDEQSLIDQMSIERLAQAVTAEIMQENPGMSEADSKAELQKRLMNVEVMGPRLAAERGQMNLLFASRKPNVVKLMRDTVETLLGEEGLDQEDNPSAQELASVLKHYANDDVKGFNASVASYGDFLKNDETKTVNVGKIVTEAYYNGAMPLFFSMILYVTAGLFTCVSWMDYSKSFGRTAFWLVIAGFLLHTFGLALRIYISGRAPVTSIYSSAVFIGWGVVLFCMVLEILFRMGIGNMLASVGGFLTLLIASNLAQGQDTFSVMVAVLDTQFWLWTHVTSISLGYITAFVAGGLGVVFVFASFFTPFFNKDFRKVVYQMMYGIICFSILFSFVGTVLGGLWADDSWGRFWGWDPKENGALMIVLWNAVVLHARWGGMVRERGFACLTIIGGMVTAWSWFAVNELGIGLHSYGFTKGVLFYLIVFWLSQLAVLAVAILPLKIWWSYRANPA